MRVLTRTKFLGTLRTGDIHRHLIDIAQGTRGSRTAIRSDLAPLVRSRVTDGLRTSHKEEGGK